MRWAWLGWNDPRRVSLLSVLGVGVGRCNGGGRTWKCRCWLQYVVDSKVLAMLVYFGSTDDVMFNRLTRW